MRAASSAAARARGRAQRAVRRDQSRKALAAKKAADAKKAAAAKKKALAAAEAARKATREVGLPDRRRHLHLRLRLALGPHARRQRLRAPPSARRSSAMSTGTVTFAGPEGGYGNKVEIEYWDGTVSVLRAT